MDFLEQPEIKSAYDRSKYIVKLWEHRFKKTHKRLPSRLDFREADKKVREAYRQYYYLKSQALEESFRDVDGFNSNSDNESSDPQQQQKTPVKVTSAPIAVGTHLETNDIVTVGNATQPETNDIVTVGNATQPKTNDKGTVDNATQPKTNDKVAVGDSTQPETNDPTWGSHLDNKVKTTDKSPKVVKRGGSFNSTVGKKLLCGNNKFARRGAKKFNSLHLSKVSSSTPESAVSDAIESQSQPIGSFDLSDLKTVEDDSLSFLSKSSSFSLSQPGQKAKATPTNLVQSVLDNRYKPLKTIDPGWLKRVGEKTGVDVSEIALAPTRLDYDSDSDIVDSSDSDTSRPKVKKTKSERQQPPRLSKTRVSQTREADDSSEADPYHSDNDPRDPEFSPDTTREQLTSTSSVKPVTLDSVFSFNESDDELSMSMSKKAVKPKKRQKKKVAEAKAETKDERYELEYSIKPRLSVPRFKNIKKLIEIESGGGAPSDSSCQPRDHKRQQLLSKLEKKIESGNLNENFVSINLNKKIYARGKRTTNFAKYKKQQFKERQKWGKQKNDALCGPNMDMGGCDGGELVCFTCGKTGHFARNCKNDKGDSLLSLAGFEEGESVCPYPTLEEASQLAEKERNLVVRTSNMATAPETSDSVIVRKSNMATPETSDGAVDNELFDDDSVTDELLLAATLQVEEHAAKVDHQQYTDQVKVVTPFYDLDPDGAVIDTPPEVYGALAKFGHASFRPGQEEAVMRILSGKSTLVTLSTGSGKSLIYQLPAYLYASREHCISLIISPLVALMEDQVTGIPAFLKAVCLHTNQTKVQRDKIREMITSGKVNVLLVSPEAVVAGEKSSNFGSLLRQLPPIAFACIDEAHCVSQWSHNFRPSYLMICRVLRDKMGVQTVVGLTATATRSTSDSIIRHLQIPDGRNGIISDTPLPDNLVLTVSKDQNRDQALMALLLSERLKDCNSIIVYCTRREECERVAKFLRTMLQDFEGNVKKRKRGGGVEVVAEPYHAGLTASRRRTIQKRFMSGDLRIVVATVAFGMGINKSDIRSVIHYNMPKSFESYVQEIGRAGRDGLPAHCHLFLDSRGGDENELRRHIHANSIDRHVVRKLLQKVFLPCSCQGTCPRHEVAFSIEETVKLLDLPEENISTLLCYLELHERRYVELLSNAYVACKVISYGGADRIKIAARECVPLAMALALKHKDSKSGGDKGSKGEGVVEFAVIDIAAAIGWDSGICKHKLKNLEWTAVNGLPKRSTLTVEFSNLGFRLLAPGNLSDEQLDEALDSLHNHVLAQEKTALLQLKAVHQTLVEVATPSFKFCLNSSQDSVKETNVKLKSSIRRYFESDNPLETIEESVTLPDDGVQKQVITESVHQLLGRYPDTNFTGRTVARIFHGIQSPNYPAVIWGRCGFWRRHLGVDFNEICRVATAEILKNRR